MSKVDRDSVIAILAKEQANYYRESEGDLSEVDKQKVGLLEFVKFLVKELPEA